MKIGLLPFAVLTLVCVLVGIGWVAWSRNDGNVAARSVMSLDPRDSEVLEHLADGAEPTWILLEEISLFNGDRLALEAILRQLEQRKLVTRSREPSVNPDRPPMELDDWWTLTPEGWAAQGRKMPRT